MIRARLLFVCLGNICRSPTAEGVMRSVVVGSRLEPHVLIDSAGTSAYHQGELPDPRSRHAAARRGIALEHRARGVVAADFERFDYLLAMDRDNLRELESRAPRERAPTLRLLRSFDPSAPEGAEVPDPYYGGEQGFDDVLDMVERACRGLLSHLERTHGRP